MLEAYTASPEIDLGRDIPKLRFLIERYEAPLRAALPPISEVSVTDRLVPGSPGDPDVRVRTYEPDGSRLGFGRHVLDPRRRHGHRHDRR